MSFMHAALALTVILIWGLNFVFIKIALVDVPPLMLCFIRFFLTSLPAIFFLKFPKTPVRRVIRYGIVMFAIQFSLLFFGMSLGISAGLASLLIQMQVFFGILMGMLFFDEKLHYTEIIGGLISLSGIMLIANHLGEALNIAGFLFVISAALCSGMGNVIAKKIGKVNMLSLVVWSSLAAWPPLLVLCLFMEGPKELYFTFTHLSLQGSIAILYITYLSTLFAYWGWNYLLHHYHLSKVVPFGLLVPIIGMLSSSLMLDEVIESWKIYAAMLVILGLLVYQFGPKILKKYHIKND